MTVSDYVVKFLEFEDAYAKVPVKLGDSPEIKDCLKESLDISEELFKNFNSLFKLLNYEITISAINFCSRGDKNENK